MKIDPSYWFWAGFVSGFKIQRKHVDWMLMAWNQRKEKEE